MCGSLKKNVTGKGVMLGYDLIQIYCCVKKYVPNTLNFSINQPLQCTDIVRKWNPVKGFIKTQI